MHGRARNARSTGARVKLAPHYHFALLLLLTGQVPDGGITVRIATKKLAAEEAPDSYKDVSQVRHGWCSHFPVSWSCLSCQRAACRHAAGAFTAGD